MKTKLLYLSALLFIFINAKSVNYYWVGGAGNWSDINHWATTSGGSVLQSVVPSQNDDVFFDAGSGFTLASRTITVNVIANCHNMTWTGALNTPTITAGSTNLMNIYGSMALQSGMAYKIDKTYFKSTFAGETITTNGTTITGFIYFDGTNGGWTLQDDLTEVGSLDGIFLYQGHLNTNSKTLNISAFGDLGATASHSLTLGSSVITTNIGGWQYNHALAILNAGTSHIKFNGSYGFETKSGHVYYNTSCYKPLNGGASVYSYNTNNVTVHRAMFYDNATINGSGRFDTLVFSAGKKYELASANTQTIASAFTATAAPCSGLIEISSVTSGSQTTFHFLAGSVANISNALIKDVRVTGAVAPLSVTNSFDLGNNTNILFTPAVGNNLYWVGGTGVWNDTNHWSFTSGGAGGACVPTPVDDVFFDANSGFTLASRTVSLTGVGQYCHNMTWTGALNTPTITAGSTNLMNIYGSMALQSGMAYKIDKTYFKSTFAGETITTNGTTITGFIYFDGTNGGWTLQDDLTEVGSLDGIFLYQGHLNTNSKTLNISAFGDLGATASHSLTLGSSVITTNIGGWQYNHALAILNAGTSHIKFNGSYGFETKSGHVYYNTSCYKPLNGGASVYSYNTNNVTVHRAMFYDNATINGSGRFDTLVFSAGKKYELASANTQTIASAFTATAAPCSGLIEISSVTSGSQTTFHFLAGSVANISNALIKDVRVTGAVAPLSVTNSFDLGNNTNILFTPAVGNNLYWVGGTGVWNDTNHWSFTSGGAGGACVPTPVDDVFFDANSGFTLASRTVSLTGVGQYCHNMTWTGALNTPTITAGSTNLMNIYGSMALQSGMAYKIDKTYFKSTFAGETITTNGTTITGFIYFDGTNGGWTLQDDLTEVGSLNGIFLYQGHLNTNSKTLNISAFGDLGATASHSLTLGSSVITTNIGGWQYNHALAILNAGTSHIKFNGSYGFETKSGHVYYNTSCYKPLNGGASVYSYNTNNVTVHRAMFYDNATINGSGRFDTLVFSAGKAYNLQANTTQTITQQLYASGNPCYILFLKSNTAGTRANINVQAGVVNYDYTNIIDINATPSYAPLQMAGHSTDAGNNLNISFAPTLTTGIVGLGPDVTVCQSALPLTLNTSQFYPNPATTFTWTGGATTNTLSANTAGTYSIFVNYGAACTVTDNIVISVTAPTVTASSSIICSGNTSTLSVLGASTYTWSNSSNASSIVVNPTVTTTYSVVGTTTTGCVANAVTVVTVTSGPTISIASVSNNSVCSGNNSIITPNGASTYTLLNTGATGTSFTVSPTASTTYSILGTTSGCNSNNVAQTTIVVNTTPTVGIATVSSSSVCSGNNSIITPSGASTYTLLNTGATGTSFTVSPTVNTTYSIVGTSSANCNANNVAQTTIVVNTTPTVGIASVSSSVICSGNSTTITPSGASSYTLFPGNITGSAFTLNPTTSTTYSIIGTSSDNCNSSNVATSTIVVNATPTITAMGATSATICSGEVFTITPTGASAGSYTLMPDNITTNSSFTVSPAANVTYSINGANTNGCVSTTSSDLNVSLTVNTTPTVNALFSSNALCSSQQVTITLSGADASYTLNPGNTSISASTASAVITPVAGTTIYTITASNSNGCVSTLSQQIYTTSVSVVTNPTITASAITSSICSGTTASITPFGASTFTLMPDNISINSGQTFTLNPTVATTYTINGTATGGCTSIASTQLVTTISIYNTPTITAASALSNTICSGLTTTLSASGATSYTWAGGPVSMDYTVSPNATTVYTVIGSDANGCSNAAAPTTLTLVVNGTPTVAITNTMQASCGLSNGSVTLTTTGGTGAYTYSWVPTSITSYTTLASINGSLSVGTTTICVIDDNGCATNTVVAITNPNVPIVTHTVTHIICYGTLTGAITTDVVSTSACSYTWSNNTYSADLTGVGAGVYTVTIQDGNLCATTQTIAINQPSVGMSLQVTNMVSACFNQTNGSVTVTATGGMPAYSYSWQPISNNTNVLSNVAIGNYTVYCTDNNGCKTNTVIAIASSTNPVTLSLNNTTPATCEQNNGAITINVTGGAPQYSYTWLPTNSSNQNLENASVGNYTVIVTDNTGCEDSLTVTLNCNVALFVPQFFSPNGNGQNDVFEIKGIENYPNNEVSIFNRWGNLVYTKKQYDNTFNGKANVSNSTGTGLLPAGVYFIIIDFGDNGTTKPYHGYIDMKY